MHGDCVINALQTSFYTEQRAVIQANSDEEKEVSGWGIVKVIAGGLLAIVGVATIIGSWGTLSVQGIQAIAGGILLAGRRNETSS